MANAIGLRVYTLKVYKRRSKTPLQIDGHEIGTSISDFIKEFVSAHSSVIQNADLARSWFFEEKGGLNTADIQGYINYGTFGFESNFIDSKTKKKNYRRKMTDIEEIPLYFRFMFPRKEHFCFFAFQSFQGRSCVGLVKERLRTQFEEKFPDFIISFNKVMPNDSKNAFFSSSPIKKIRLIRRKISTDVADLYLDSGKLFSVDMEISINAKKKGALGFLPKFLNSVKNNGRSVITYEGHDFEEAVAEVRFGNKTRSISIIGADNNVGVIDLSGNVKLGVDGHPTLDSIRDEVGEILEDFLSVMKGDSN